MASVLQSCQLWACTKTSDDHSKKGITMTTAIGSTITQTIHSSKFSGKEDYHSKHNTLWSTLADVCQLLQLNTKIQDETITALFRHRYLKLGQQAYAVGQAFDALYVVNAGFLKTALFDKEGNERVLSFPMKGDLLGADGIWTDHHSSDVVALSDCDLIVIPFKQLLSLGHACQELEHIIYRIVSRQIVQENINLATLGLLRSDSRVACFLVMEADRHCALGFSGNSFRLRMTRRDIGSYLGLTLETVSRSLSALHAAGLICIDQRDIKILQTDNLRSFQQWTRLHPRNYTDF